MSEKTHWMQSPNKNYLGHWDLPESGEMIVTIKSAKWEEVKNPINNKSEVKRVIRFKEDIKPLICNQTNAQSIVRSTGIKFMEDSEGASICLYLDSVRDRILKEDVDCIRVRRINPYSLEVLTSLYNSKKSKLTDDLKLRADTIINDKEVSSYQKLIKHLQTL